jgi:hypothetical protein
MRAYLFGVPKLVVEEMRRKWLVEHSATFGVPMSRLLNDRLSTAYFILVRCDMISSLCRLT